MPSSVNLNILLLHGLLKLPLHEWHFLRLPLMDETGVFEVLLKK